MSCNCGPRVVAASTRRIVERWDSQYSRHFGSDFRVAGGKKPEEIHNELVALGDRPKIKDVERIIGNQSWTRLLCSGCNEYALRLAEFSDGGITILMCAGCLQDGLDALGKKGKRT